MMVVVEIVHEPMTNNTTMRSEPSCDDHANERATRSTGNISAPRARELLCVVRLLLPGPARPRVARMQQRQSGTSYSSPGMRPPAPRRSAHSQSRCVLRSSARALRVVRMGMISESVFLRGSDGVGCACIRENWVVGFCCFASF